MERNKGKKQRTYAFENMLIFITYCYSVYLFIIIYYLYLLLLCV